MCKVNLTRLPLLLDRGGIYTVPDASDGSFALLYIHENVRTHRTDEFHSQRNWRMSDASDGNPRLLTRTGNPYWDFPLSPRS
jgi:hypothetical protein